MTRARLSLFLVLCAVWPARAFAQIDWIDWAQPGSGPGPYRGHHGVFSRVFCVKDDGSKFRPAWCFDDSDEEIRLVVDVQYGNATSDNPRFSDLALAQDQQNNASVTVNTFDASYSYRVSRFLDVGVAIGSLTFSGQGFDTDSHLTLTPFRISFVPIAFFHGDLGKRLGRVIRITYLNRRIVGDITAKKFNSSATYTQRGEFNQGVTVGVDLVPVVVWWLTKK